MDELAERLATLRDRVTTPWDELRSDRAIAGLARLRRQRRMRQVRIAAGAVAMAAGALLYLRSPWSPSVEPAQSSVRGTPETEPHSVALPERAVANTTQPAKRLLAGESARLSDGSRVAVKSADGQLFVDADRADDIALRLERGSARFDVVRNLPRRFSVAVGEVEVLVVGTSFEVERAAGRIRVSVSHGKVRVHGAAVETFVEGGESRWFEASGAPSSDAPAPSGRARTATRGTAPDSRTAARSAPPALHEEQLRAPDWRSLNESGDYERAYELLANGAHVEDNAETLMDAADAARLSNHAERAAAYLGRVLRDHRNDPSTPLAAFTLGLVLLDRLARPAEAAQAFAEARALAPHGSLAQDALAREVEAWSKAGRAPEAYQRARQFVQAYPESRRVPAVRIYGGLRAP